MVAEMHIPISAAAAAKQHVAISDITGYAGWHIPISDTAATERHITITDITGCAGWHITISDIAATERHIAISVITGCAGWHIPISDTAAFAGQHVPLSVMSVARRTAHRRSDIAVTTATSLPLDSLPPSLERGTHRARPRARRPARQRSTVSLASSTGGQIIMCYNSAL